MSGSNTTKSKNKNKKIHIIKMIFYKPIIVYSVITFLITVGLLRSDLKTF